MPSSVQGFPWRIGDGGLKIAIDRKVDILTEYFRIRTRAKLRAHGHTYLHTATHPETHTHRKTL